MLQHVQGLFAAMPTPAMTSPTVGRTRTFAKDVARKVVASLGPDPTPSSRQRREHHRRRPPGRAVVERRHRVQRGHEPAGSLEPCRVVEATMPAWQTMVEPIVSTVASNT